MILSTHFITALGHAANAPLLQKIADKHFITPTALGQCLNDIYNNTIAELQNSKAKLVDQITKQFEAGYSKQIDNLKNDITSIERTSKREVSILNSQLQAAKEEKETYTNQVRDLQQQLETANGIGLSTILLIIAALIIGLLIGKIFM